jgi:cell cycle arrest protein BUB3
VHPSGTFATGGGDGTVAIWDRAAKKRIVALPAFGAPISSLDFSPDGALLAIAASYDWSQGDPSTLDAAARPPPDAILIRQLSPAEVTPKGKT